jgi:hypothetical protein
MKKSGFLGERKDFFREKAAFSVREKTDWKKKQLSR